jgi:hypothetical protein
MAFSPAANAFLIWSSNENIASISMYEEPGSAL